MLKTDSPTIGCTDHDEPPHREVSFTVAGQLTVEQWADLFNVLWLTSVAMKRGDIGYVQVEDDDIREAAKALWASDARIKW